MEMNALDQIKLVKIDSLHLHEHSVPEHLKKLYSTMKRDNYVESPIVVDKETHVVLDGVHRVKVLGKNFLPSIGHGGLGCSYIPAFLVDYRESVKKGTVKISRWYRVIRNHFNVEEMLSHFNDQKEYKVTYRPSNEVEEMLDKRRVVTAFLLSDGEHHVLEVKNYPRTIKEHYNLINQIYYEIMRILEIKSPVYMTEKDAEKAVIDGRAAAALIVPHVNCEQVIASSLNGDVFPPKTSRHIVEGRPIYTYIPIKWLYEEGQSFKEKNSLVKKFLSKGSWMAAKPFRDHRGRLYNEKVYIVFPEKKRIQEGKQ